MAQIDFHGDSDPPLHRIRVLEVSRFVCYVATYAGGVQYLDNGTMLRFISAQQRTYTRTRVVERLATALRNVAVVIFFKVDDSFACGSWYMLLDT